MFRPRTLTVALKKALETFPAIILTGPRQSGKTTLLKHMFSRTHRFVSLENPDIRMRAIEDPAGFLEDNSPPIIIDEIQYAPQLLSYIKSKIDLHRKPGQWLLTGSQNFALMAEASQSLAGRAAVLTLLPFSLAERIGKGVASLSFDYFIKKLPMNNHLKPISISDILLRGNYPEIALTKAVDRQLWCSSYISTYLERDVRNLSNIGDLNQFERFLKLCATRTGQILNLSNMAKDIGVSVPTAKRWISILEAGYQIFLLYPYYKNLGKRLIKSPKLYFTDTALAAYLLGIHDAATLKNSPNFGSLFESFIVIDFLKRFYNFGQMPSLYYLRTRDGAEIDLLIEIGQKLSFFEIKSGMTITPKHASPLISMSKIPGVDKLVVISRAKEDFLIKNNIYNYNWAHLLSK